MQTIGKSTLVGKTVKCVGFGFDQHPLLTGAIQFSIYSLNTAELVLCLSTVEHPDIPQAREGLGADVEGALIAPFAVRRLKGVPLVELKTILSETYLNAKFEWVPAV